MLPGEGRKLDLGHSFSLTVYIVRSCLTLVEDHLCLPRLHSYLQGWGSCSLNPFSVGRTDLSSPLSRDVEEREPRKLIARHITLKNRIFMGVNESETYGENFLACHKQSQTPSLCPPRGCLECQCWCQNPGWKGQGRGPPLPSYTSPMA